jgi:hypothetical protein
MTLNAALGLPHFSTADNALLRYAYPADFDSSGFFGLSLNTRVRQATCARGVRRS